MGHSYNNGLHTASKGITVDALRVTGLATATTIAVGSNGAALPQATINVASTTGFPTSGTIYVTTGAGVQTVTYTGVTATTFTGCSGGTGTMSTGGFVGPNCTIAEDCKAGLVSLVKHTATGTYVFQLTAPFPPKVVAISPDISAANATAALLRARYVNGSYNATTGQFTVVVSSAVPAAADGGASDELHVRMHFNRYTR